MKKILAMVVAMVMVLGMVGCGKSEAPTQSTETNAPTNVTTIDNTKVESETENVTEIEEKEYEIIVITQLCKGRAFWGNEEHTKNYNISEEDAETYYGKTLEVTFTVYDWNDYTYEITKVIEQTSLEGWGRNSSALVLFRRPRTLLAVGFYTNQHIAQIIRQNFVQFAQLTFSHNRSIIIIERNEREVIQMREDKWLWLDMDGTFVDFYGVIDWLECLIAHDTKPYRVAKCLYNEYELLEVLFELKLNGWNIGIISWSSKENNAEFDKKVEQAKREWMFEKCLDIIIDKMIVTPYGVCKADTCRKYGFGVLADDEEQNRNAWDLGATIDANNNLIEELKKLLVA